MKIRVPAWLAEMFFRALLWVLVARCWILGGDHRALRAALQQSLVLFLKYGRIPATPSVPRG